MDIVRSRQFGKLVRRRRTELGLTQADVAGRVGAHPDTGKYLGETQVSRVEAGMKEMDRWLIERLIEALEMDPDEGWEAATGAPPGFTTDGYRKVLADARAERRGATGDSHEKLTRIGAAAGQLLVFPQHRAVSVRRVATRFAKVA